MKKTSISAMLVVCLCNLLILLGGCMHSVTDSSQPGETMAEGSRRHDRINRIQQQEMMRDIDHMFLYDKPSGLDEMVYP
jgi:hypothetical protein